MRTSRWMTFVFALALVASPVRSEAVLEVTLDSGLGTQVFTDGDNDGDVDFDTTVDAIFQARGTAKEEINQFKGKVALAPLFPNPTGIFRNLSASPQTFTVTVKSTAFAGAIAAPVGWDIFYYAATDDLVDMSVDIPSHSVAAATNGGALTLGTLAGAAINSITGIGDENHGVDPSNTAADVVLVWTMTLGANDEFKVPSDGGLDGDSIQVNVFNQTRQCIDKMNNGARKVGDSAQKIDVKCTKEVGMDVTACVDNDADEKTDKKVQKLVDDFASQCDPVPAWGVESASCCVGGTGDGDPCADAATCGGGTCPDGGCLAAATDAAANDLAHDVFGASVVISSDKTTAKCQQAAAKAAGKLYTTRWKEFRGCKRDNFPTILGDLTLRAICLEPQPDADGKILDREEKLVSAIQKKCIDKGLTGIGAILPGACSAAADNAVGACLVRQAACRFCVSANAADAIVPAVDCDEFDDAASNGTCP